MQPDRDAVEISQVRDGDLRALQRLAERWGPRIERLCYRMTGDRHIAEDLAQETFLRLWQRRDQLVGSSLASTYLWRIAINLCRDVRRRAELRPTASEVLDHSLADGGPGPGELLGRSESSDRVRAALDRIPADQRIVLVLRHFEGLKLRQIAEVIGIPPGTVASRLALGLRKLANELSQRPHESSSENPNNHCQKTNPVRPVSPGIAK